MPVIIITKRRLSILCTIRKAVVKRLKRSTLRKAEWRLVWVARPGDTSPHHYPRDFDRSPTA